MKINEIREVGALVTKSETNAPKNGKSVKKSTRWMTQEKGKLKKLENW